MDNKLLYDNVAYFYKNEKHLNMLLTIIKGESNVTVTLLEWFVTNYAKKKDISYKIKIDGNIENFNVFQKYLIQLRAYSKKNFDPCCRRKRLLFPYDKNTSLLTTLGQLNFFKWAIKFKIIDYINDNFNDIKQDMINIKKQNKELKMNSDKEIEKNEDEQFIKTFDDDENDIYTSEHSKKISVDFIESCKKTQKKKKKVLSMPAFDLLKFNKETIIEF